ncbi:hypothetical protein [Thermincola potens]|uniref:Uncharacterized protein n=1 Tax=Thermincola potens (strain JR) TaxID=635013 RepID=D5XE70_THEPJ|nr:hypothetical protein [Thermincola potens]ADG81941.1 conserved hypothetical protein [Thermincola potens JR]
MLKSSRNAELVTVSFLLLMSLYEGIKNNDVLNPYFMVLNINMIVFFASILYYRIKENDPDGRG